MKKIVGTIAAIALAASSAFAGVNVGMGFNRGVFAPFLMQKIGDNTNFYMTNAASWGWGGPRIGASFSASSEQIGVVADVKFDGGNVAVNDNAYIWVKPVEWFKMNIGQSFDDTLRGNACFGSWDWLRPGNILGEDLIFTRVCANPLGGAYAPLQGAILMLDPIEGLHISVGLPTGYGIAANWEDLVAKAQIQAGYTIADIAQIKAQWIGAGKNADDELEGQIEVAASVKAIEGMTLDVGAKFGLFDKEYSLAGVSAKAKPINIGLFWGMPVGALSLNANAGVEFANASIDDVDLSYTKLSIGAGVGYDLGNGMSVGADVRYAQGFGSAEAYGVKFESEEDAQLAFAAWFDKGIANGTLGVAVQGATKTGIRDIAASDFSFAVPVRVQCFF